MRCKPFVTVILFSFLSANTYAATPNIIISGTIPSSVPIHHPSNKRELSAQPMFKPIVLEKVILSSAAKKYLAEHDYQQPKETLFTTTATASLPASSLLAMNGVPVLDQGQHGTCVTFAVTGALDAAYGRSDYISQLCNLELGSTLEQQHGVDRHGEPNYPSGWDGSDNEIVLDQIQRYGVITMAYQKAYGCAGVKDYPLYQERNHGNPMSVEDFEQHDQNILKDIYYKPILKIEDAYSSKVNMDDILTKVKQAIAKGHRVVFGTLLDVNKPYDVVNGAAGTYNGTENDAWIITPQISNDKKNGKIEAGHAMIITGYDDYATIDGSETRGVLTLRNSWGEEAGVQGDYYMSYEYFKTFADEAYEISPTPLQ